MLLINLYLLEEFSGPVENLNMALTCSDRSDISEFSTWPVILSISNDVTFYQNDLIVVGTFCLTCDSKRKFVVKETAL